MSQINSKQYWEDRFSSEDWSANAGPAQTKYFADLFLDNIPQWFIHYVQENKFSVLDLGCAEGDGTNVLSSFWKNISGADISESAILKASRKYPNIHFEVQNVYQLTQDWDVIFISNVLEHFEKPFDILVEISKHTRRAVVIMVPFEETADVKEHFAKFDFCNIPVRLNGMSLIYHNNIMDYDINNARYFGQQIILVYSKDETLNEKVSISESSNIIKSWVDSGEYKNFKKRYYEMEFNYINSSYKINSLENQLQVNKDVSDNLKKELSTATDKISELNDDLKYSWSVANEKEATMKAAIAERELKINSLESELLASQKTTAQQISLIKREFMEEIKMLENNLQESKQSSIDQTTALREELQEKIQELEEVKSRLAGEKDKYENLYAYSCRRDDELVSIKNSRSYQFFIKWLKQPMSIVYRITHKIYRIAKALVTFNFAVLKQEITGPFKKIYLRIKGILDKNKEFNLLKKAVNCRRLIILPPTLDWHMPLFQRPQQLAASYARKKNTVVIYLTKNIQYDAVPAVEKISNSLWIVNEQYANKLSDIVKSASEVILSISWTPNKKYIDILHPDKFIYEYIDELEIFHMYGPEMEADHQRLMQNADVTICTATKLYNQALGVAKNPLLSPNAGDYEFFAQTESFEVSPWIKDIIPSYRCVIGYYGALAAWFDYNLIKTIAARHTDWLFVLVGIDYDGTIGKSGIDEFKNIIHIPPQPYKDLPSFLKGFDVAMIPFIINEITLSTSPVKLFEYMAAGRPILSSKMPECLKYKSVKTYSNADEFCNFIEDFMAMEKNNKYWEILKEEALANTWDARTEEILGALK